MNIWLPGILLPLCAFLHVWARLPAGTIYNLVLKNIKSINTKISTILRINIMDITQGQGKIDYNLDEKLAKVCRDLPGGVDP
jgi:hypothetical protein